MSPLGVLSSSPKVGLSSSWSQGGCTLRHHVCIQHRKKGLGKRLGLYLGCFFYITPKRLLIGEGLSHGHPCLQVGLVVKYFPYQILLQRKQKEEKVGMDMECTDLQFCHSIQLIILQNSTIIGGVVNVFFKDLYDKLQMTLDLGFKTVQYCEIQDQNFSVLEQ